MVTITMPALEQFREKVQEFVSQFTIRGTLQWDQIRVHIRDDIFYGDLGDFIEKMHDVFVSEVCAGGLTDIPLIRWKMVLEKTKTTPPPRSSPNEWKTNPRYAQMAFDGYQTLLKKYLGRACVFQDMQHEDVLRVLDWMKESKNFAFPLQKIDEVLGEAVLDILLEKNVTW